MEKETCYLLGGKTGCAMIGRGLYGPETDQAKSACSRAKSEAAWRLGGTLACAFAMYAAQKYIKPEGMLADLLGKNVSIWTKPGLTTLAGLGTVLTLGFGAEAAYRAHSASTKGVWLTFCCDHQIYG